MLAIRRAAALVLAALAVGTSSVSAQTAGAPKARFSDVTSYVGAPALPTTLSMIVAGGGPAKFDSVTLVHTLAGSLTDAEVKKLTASYGADNVKSFLDVFNFVVADALELVAKNKVPLPSAPSPDPHDGKALSAALYKLGVGSDGKYDVEYMLDELVTHGFHVQIMDDIDKKFSRKADANYHVVLTTAMGDLKDAYKL